MNEPESYPEILEAVANNLQELVYRIRDGVAERRRYESKGEDLL